MGLTMDFVRRGLLNIKEFNKMAPMVAQVLQAYVSFSQEISMDEALGSISEEYAHQMIRELEEKIKKRPNRSSSI